MNCSDMLFLLELTLLLSVHIPPAEGEVNLALNKPARQSGEYKPNEVYPASNAVNGDTSDFSHTAANKSVNWWTVDLGAKYSIGSITLYNKPEPYGARLRKVSILTSNKAQPSDPALTSGDWTRVSYQDPYYPEVATLNFNPPIEGQNVAILNTHVEGLALAEVEIRETTENSKVKEVCTDKKQEFYRELPLY
ncbi:fucolectin-4-like [Watersipora subatra]|uniref:fucolectin-4-like n=1 Tax=Watersipora subatra TaxID=2589382 RepID=UPI00355B229A